MQTSRQSSHRTLRRRLQRAPRQSRIHPTQNMKDVRNVLVSIRLRQAMSLPLEHVFMPAQRTGGPLLVLLHGTGADEHDLLPLGESIQSEHTGLAVLSLRAPLEAEYGGHCWFNGFSSAPADGAVATTVPASCRVVLECCQLAPVLFKTDPQRTVLLGFSQGATIGWSVATCSWPRPGLLAGVLLMSGRLFPEVVTPGTPLAAAAAAPAELSGRRLWVTHGRLDGTTPVALARESLDTARSLWRDDDAFTRDVMFAPHNSGHDIPSTSVQAACDVLHTWLVKT
jgi:phospholipase/carboxylesterase